MGNTPNWNIYYAENGAPGDARTESATQAGTVETALDSVGGDIVSVNNFGVRYFANASARDLALTSPSVGWLTQLDSELFMRRWDGSTWKPYGAGLYPIKPSSVSGTGVSVDTDGSIELTTITSASINGVFSSDFRDYQIEYEMTSASADIAALLRLRAAGTDNTTNYTTHYIAGAGSSTTVGTSGTTDATFLSLSGGRQLTSRAVLRGPGSARQTVMRIDYAGFNNAGAGFEGLVSARHAVSTAYDGFTLLPETGNMTGYVRIFGIG